MPMQIDQQNETDKYAFDENIIDENVTVGNDPDEMEVEPMPLMSLDDIDLTNTPDPVEPMIENHDNIEPFEPQPFEYDPETTTNDIIATPNQKDVELDTLQKVSETAVHVEKPITDPDSKIITTIPTVAVPKELLENLEHGHENVETLGYIEASALEVSEPASKKPILDFICEDEFLPDLDSVNEATNDDDFALTTSVQESVPTDSKESQNVIRDDHDYLKWSQKSTWPVIQTGT